jgi:C_GCAxxG_C_C family probable redox protein
MNETRSAEIEQIAFDHMQSGFNCAEAVSKTIIEAYVPETHPDIPRMATAFGGGTGGSKAGTCGALNGGILAIGFLLGRNEPQEDKMKAYQVAAEFRQKFTEVFGSSDCPTFLERFGEQENYIECKKMAGRAAAILYTMLGAIVPPINLRTGSLT